MAIIIRRKVKAPTPDPVVQPETKPKKKPAPGRLLDNECRVVMQSGPNAVVSWWLMAGYMYHIHDKPIISDGLFDEMSKDIADRWDSIQHQHKKIITREDLATGSLYRLAEEDYPKMVRYAAQHLVQGAWGITIPVKK